MSNMVCFISKGICVWPDFYCIVSMGVGRIFSRRGALGEFSKIFPGGAKDGEIWFLPLKTKKTTFFAENFKIQGGTKAPLPPSDAHGCISAFLHQSLDVCLVKLIAEF